MIDALTASANPALIPAIIGAVGAVVAAVLLAVVAWRAQSAQEQLAAIDKLVCRYVDQAIDEIKDELREVLDARSRGIIIGEIVKRALREVLGSEGDRRWYDRD